MSELNEGKILITDEEEAAIRDIPRKIGLTRNELGELLVDCENDALWIIKGKRVVRVK